MALKLNIKASGAVLLTDELRSFVEEKMQKLAKILDPADTAALAEIEVESVSQSRNGDSFRAEINIAFTGGFAHAEATRETLHAAIDEAIAEAKREVKKARTKHRDLVRRGAAKVKDFFRRFKS
ncbi:ribosome-associated translation inhibitor RaiA [Candidatus Kaiserbacteria bacterium]|nr:ribosome-associated translation inhibitor RaiA [Candidatus Kaiserbacteria bacterium]